MSDGPSYLKYPEYSNLTEMCSQCLEWSLMRFDCQSVFAVSSEDVEN